MRRIRHLCGLACLTAWVASGQDWPQWGQNSLHSGAVRVSAQKPAEILGQFTYDSLADAMRADHDGELLVHYMAPLVDGGEVFIMSRGNSQWVSCSNAPAPCQQQRWGQMEWGVTKLLAGGSRPARLPGPQIPGEGLEAQWTAISTWKPPPDNGSGWEPVFHPALSGNYLFMPGGAGAVIKVDRGSGALLETLQPFGTNDPNRFVTSPLTVGADGSIYYTVMGLDAANPWGADVKEAWLVKIDSSGRVQKAAFAGLTPGAPTVNCVTTFSREALPWPPAPGARPPVARCGSQRPGVNAAPAVAPDGTIYVVSRSHFNGAYSYLVAANADLTLRWAASLRDRLSDGCDVLLPPSGTVGGCRAGRLRGVDPTTNDLPAGAVLDQSSASPVIAPDGSVLYGAWTRYNYTRGHLFHFSPAGTFLGAYDFGWDTTPAIYEHDGTWSAILKDNFYPAGSYCSVSAVCGQGTGKYNLISLGPDLRREWAYENTNDQLCERLPDGSLLCVPWTEGFEWCINMVAVDRDGVAYANSEDGNLYAIKGGTLVGRLFLKAALGAAYTPLAIADDGRLYTQNDGTLFATGDSFTRLPPWPRGR